MSGIALNSGHALLRGWVTPGYPVVYTAVHRNPDGVPQSWAAPSLHIGAGPQSSTAAATYTGADVALSDLVEGSVTYANARATWTLTAAATTSWAADPSVWITDAGWLVAGGSISTRSVYRGAEVQCLLDGVVYVTVNPVTAATIAAALGYTPADAAAIGNADNLLTGTVADARLPVTAQAATLAATFGGLPAAYIDPRTMADGAVTTLSRGTLSASYGNSPAAISSGRITFAPTSGSNSASYIEADLTAQCGRLGMEIEWPSGSDCTFALVIPAAGGWLAGIGNAGVHMTITSAGVVSCGRYISNSLVGTQTTRIGPQTGRHSIEVLLDTKRTEITVLVDGVTIHRYVDATAWSYLSDRAIWELFLANGTSGTPGYIRSAWADVEKVIPPSPLGLQIPQVRKGYGAMFSDAASINLSTTYRSTIAIGTLSVYVPPSGRMLCRYRTWITANALATNRRVYGSIAGAADQALMWGGQLGAVTCEVVVTGTPGALQVLTPQMWAEDASGTVTVTVSSTSGVTVMSAIPLEAVVT